MEFPNPFKRSFSKSELDGSQFLGQCRLFNQLSVAERVAFVPYLFEREYQQGEALFLKNDPSQAVYLIKAGTVELSLDINGKLENLGKRHNYRLLGEEAFFPNMKRCCHAIVVSPKVQLIAIPQDHLFDVLEKQPAIKAKLMAALAQSYQSFVTRLFETYTKEHGFFELNRAFSR